MGHDCVTYHNEFLHHLLYMSKLNKSTGRVDVMQLCIPVLSLELHNAIDQSRDAIRTCTRIYTCAELVVPIAHHYVRQLIHCAND